MSTKQTKTVLETQAGHSTAPLKTMMKNSGRILYYLLAVVCASAFFIHELLERESHDVSESRAIYRDFKKNRKAALEGLKQLNYSLADGEIGYDEFLAKQKGLVTVYRDISNQTDEAYSTFNEKEERQMFFHFPSKYWFFGEFWAVGILIYVFFTIVSRMINRRKDWTHRLLIDGAMLYCSLYHSAHLFIPKDFSKPAYYISLLAVTILLILGIHYLIKYRNWLKGLVEGKKLLKIIESLSRFVLYRGKELAGENKAEYIKGYRKALKEGME